MDYTSSNMKYSQGYSNIKKGWVNSFMLGQKREHSGMLSDYLNSQQSQTQSEYVANSEPNQIVSSTMTLQQKYYLMSPELYESYRNETCIEQIKGEEFKILRFSNGRNEMYFANMVEVEVPEKVKLTLWDNGDYKLIINQEVYFWHEEEKLLDKYCLSI